jgi:hypothetical protein
MIFGNRLHGKAILPCLTLFLAAVLLVPIPGRSQVPDGRHDFDFGFGTWHTSIEKLDRSFVHSNTWLKFSGTVTGAKIWKGAATLEEIEADGAGRHFEILSVRTYNPQTHQWSITGASSAGGPLGPSMYGTFNNGRGVFYDQEPSNGRMVLVRQTFFDISANAYSFEQALSDDGGATWEPNFKAHLTRLSSSTASEGAQSVADTSHDFDFNYGTWTTHIRNLDVAANGAKTWSKLTGTVALRKIWNGRAFMEEIKAGNAGGGFEGLTLYLYDPQSHQWSQTYADRSDGAFEQSMFGGFNAGRGYLIGRGQFGGKNVLMRDEWSAITPDAHHFQISYSSDGGTHWQPMFIANLTRAGPGL